MHHRPICALIALVLIAMLPACSEQATEEEGPGGVVQRFYRHLNDGDYAGAKSLYSSDALAVLDDPEISSPEAFENWAQGRTHQGTIDSVMILGTEAGEGQTLIEYQINYGDGSSVTDEVAVTEEDGQFKLGLSG